MNQVVKLSCLLCFSCQTLDEVVNFPYLLCFSCQNLDEVAQNHQLSPVPLAMVNLETWIPNNYQVEDWQVEDVGRLVPGGRLVHFILYFLDFELFLVLKSRSSLKGNEENSSFWKQLRRQGLKGQHNEFWKKYWQITFWKIILVDAVTTSAYFINNSYIGPFM